MSDSYGLIKSVSPSIGGISEYSCDTEKAHEPDVGRAFKKYHLYKPGDSDDLGNFNSFKMFSDTGKIKYTQLRNKKLAILVDETNSIVRTTMLLDAPAQKFGPEIEDLISHISRHCKKSPCSSFLVKGPAARPYGL